jgi:hypothetical protein
MILFENFFVWSYSRVVNIKKWNITTWLGDISIGECRDSRLICIKTFWGDECVLEIAGKRN